MAEIKKKNKKKIGSNVDNLRNLEPQPEQTFLIKKNKCNLCAQNVLVNPVLGFKNFVGLKENVCNSFIEEVIFLVYKNLL